MSLRESLRKSAFAVATTVGLTAGAMADDAKPMPDAWCTETNEIPEFVSPNNPHPRFIYAVGNPENPKSAADPRHNIETLIPGMKKALRQKEWSALIYVTEDAKWETPVSKDLKNLTKCLWEQDKIEVNMVMQTYPPKTPDGQHKKDSATNESMNETIWLFAYSPEHKDIVVLSYDTRDNVQPKMIRNAEQAEFAVKTALRRYAKKDNNFSENVLAQSSATDGKGEGDAAGGNSSIQEDAPTM